MLEVFLRQKKSQKASTMSNLFNPDNERLFGNVSAALVLSMGSGYLIQSLYQLSPIIAGAVSIIIIGFIAYMIMRYVMAKSTKSLERDICKQLDKQGYRHEKKDGTLYVMKNDNQFRVYIRDGYDKRIKHLYILYDFGDDNFERVNSDGWSRAANTINENNTQTTFVVLEDHFCCCYQTAIGHPDYFQREFDTAYHTIGEALEDYKKIYPHLEQDYPNNVSGNKSGIGFK